MRIFAVTMLGIAAMFSSAASGQVAVPADGQESIINYVTFQPCSSWSYDGSVSGYKCNFTGYRVSVPEYRDVQRLADLVDTLERKIADLEARVASLEN